VFALFSVEVTAAEVYGPFPITLNGYSGDKSNSASYSGQIARHLLHNSLKKALGAGAPLETTMGYFNGSDAPLPSLDPKSSDKFPVDVDDINALSKTNLSGKAYKGSLAGWPGAMSGKKMLVSMIEHASKVDKGFDEKHGYDYVQLVSKFTMGGVFYAQACDNYLDEKLAANNKPNNKPYKDGAHYTGKEHSWDEAFGYWGAAAHGATLSAAQNYNIAKKKDSVAADANLNGVVNLQSEMNFAHAYYASGFDKGGATNYYNTITKAFIDGRQVITDANGKALSDDERTQIMGKARVICSTWERVIAEAVFKYAGSVYGDLLKLRSRADQDTYRAYVKHWGELKGFALSLHTGAQNLGELGDMIDSLTGFGPVVGGATPSNPFIDGRQVNGVDADGGYSFTSKSADDYMIDMLRLQKLMEDDFGVVAKNNDKLASIQNLAEKLGSGSNSEND
jgi:hypothetical protein